MFILDYSNYMNSSNSFSSYMVDFVISNEASNRFIQLVEEERKLHLNKVFKFRVEILGGGCSGFQYKYYLDTNDIAEDDVILEIKDTGIKVVIDNASFAFVNGSILEYIENLGSAYFQVKNPNAKANCGCGNSFSI